MRAILVLSFLCLSLQIAFSAEKYEWAPRPTVMSIRAGSAMGKQWQITYDRRVVRYYSAKRYDALLKTEPIIVTPSEEEWKEFYDELDRIKVWKWKKDYVNRDIYDGWQWDAIVIYPGVDSERHLIAEGSNARPEEYRAFVSAIRKLIGGRQFDFDDRPNPSPKVK